MKNSIICAIFVCITAIFGALSLNFTTANSNAPQVLGVYVQGFENDRYTKQNFTAFTGSTVLIEVQSDTNLLYHNYDGATVMLVSNEQNVYTISITSLQPMQTQVVFENDSGYDFINVEFVENVVNDITVEAPFMVSNVVDNAFNLVYNHNSMLKYEGAVEYSLKQDEVEVALRQDSAYVVDISNAGITLDFSATAGNTSATLCIKAGESAYEYPFTISGNPLSDRFYVNSSSVGYLDGSETVVVNVEIQADSLARFDVPLNNVCIVDIIFLSQADGRDTYVITLDISKLDSQELVLIEALTAQGQVLRGVNLHKIDAVTSFEITSEKSTFSPNETIVISAVVDGNETLSGNIVWYVNGIEYSTGATLTMTRSEGGNFTVYAMINDVQSNTLNLSITYQSVELIIWYCVLAITVLVLIGLIVFKKKKKSYYMSTSLLERARKIIPRYETFINNYNRRQFKNLIYDLAMIKDDTYSNFNDTKDFCFERAGRGFAGALSEMKQIFKADNDKRKELFIENTKSIEDNIKMALSALEEYSQAHPNEKIFAFNRKKKKKQKVESDNKSDSK